MSDRKVLIFGSFTEEETRLFQRQSIEHVHSLEEPGVQFGSLDFASLSSCEGSITGPKSHNSSTESKSVLVSNIISDLTCKNASTKVNKPQKGTGNQTNGDTISYGQNDKFMEKEKDTLGLMSLHITEREAADSDLSVAPKFQEGWIQASKANSIPITLNDKRVNAKSILPRGLINLGNLCFLNATLQALLSCSPFVQLLQDLRSGNIPEVLVV